MTSTEQKQKCLNALREFISTPSVGNCTAVVQREKEIALFLEREMDTLNADERLAVYGFIESIFPKSFWRIITARLANETDRKCREFLTVLQHRNRGLETKWYVDAVAELIARGVFPSIQDENRLSIASATHTTESKKTFWIMNRGDCRYFVVSPLQVYRIPQDGDIVELCVRTAKGSPDPDFPKEIVRQFRLQHVSAGESSEIARGIEG